MADNDGLFPAPTHGNETASLGEPVDFDVRGLGRRLPRTLAPEGWVKKVNRHREGKIWVGFFHIWTTVAGYGATAVGRVRTYIKACFECAADEDLVEKNPVRKLVMPNIRKKSCERFLTVDELRAILAHASPREHLVLRILAVCGMRPSEGLVLRIEDFEGSQLRVDEALKERQKGEDRIGSTKTVKMGPGRSPLRFDPLDVERFIDECRRIAVQRAGFAGR